MLGRVLALSALVAIGHSKAIITNNCRKDVYIWSVPEKADLANNLSISPGKRYEEPWRSGTSTNPGVAIKVSTEHDGIYTGKSEINFQYDVDASDSTKIWVNLATVRGSDLDTATLNTCHGAYKSANVPTEQCSSTDDIELVLCGSERTVPSRDSTPIRVISNCIGLLFEHDDPLHPRMCSGRVVGPKRIPMLPDEHEDDWLAEFIATVPLKTVLRREAAKHASSQDAEAHNTPSAPNTAAGAPEKTTEKSMSSGPMCNLLHEAWPDAHCDEKMAQHNAKLFYRDNCGDKTKNMFPGASCEAIRRQMEQIYPGVVANQDHVAMCITPYYERFWQLWGQDVVTKAILNNEGFVDQSFLPGVSWTSDDEVCRNAYKRILPIRKAGRRCVKPFCDGFPGGCSDVEDELERLSKDAGLEIDWTSSDDECFYKRAVTENRDVNTIVTTQRDINPRVVCIHQAYDKLLRFPLWQDKFEVKSFLRRGGPYHMYNDAGIIWTSDEERCQRRSNPVSPIQTPWKRPCVTPYCSHDCSDLEDAFNTIYAQAGFYDVDWTTGDEADFDPYHQCVEPKHSTLAPRQDVNVSVGTDHRWNDVRKVCITTANEKLGKYWGANQTEEWIPQIFSRVTWTENLDDCSPQAIAESRAYHHKLIDKKQKKEKKCVVGCQGKTCKRVKKELNKLSNDVGEIWSWTDDEKVCASNITFGPEGPKVDRCIMGENAINRLWGSWGNAHSDMMNEIFPGTIWTDDECNLPYDLAAKKWFNDRHVKERRVQRCVKPYCQPFNADCSDVEDQLEEVSKNLGRAFDWTTDDDACPEDGVRNTDQVALNRIGFIESSEEEPDLCKSLLGEASVEKLQRYWGKEYQNMLADDIFSDLPIATDFDTDCDDQRFETGKRWIHDHRAKRGRRCVKPYCQPYNADCSDVEDALEKVSKNIGQDIDWTTDDDVCPKNAIYPVNHVLNNHDQHFSPEYCILATCQLLTYSTKECAENLDLLEEALFGQSGVRVKLTVDGPACKGTRMNEVPHFPPSIQAKRRSHKVCRQDLCRRYSQSDHDCQKVERKVRSFLNKTMQIDVDFADSPDICDPTLGRASFEEPMTYASNTSIAH
ncbi:hypothetical protein DPSP01_003303 [Paraphaeosphaeria sporulosa]